MQAATLAALAMAGVVDVYEHRNKTNEVRAHSNSCASHVTQGQVSESVKGRVPRQHACGGGACPHQSVHSWFCRFRE